MSEADMWWKYGVVYHILPQSFKDTNEDGIGDLEGIIQKLDYLSDLGIDAIWLSPVYQSPMIDAGYDISDYQSINPLYGDMNDFRRLLDRAHRKNIRVIMDLVLNHTSDRHPWFIESRASKDNPKRDWYIWQPPANKRKSPNNWKTNFGRAAWTLDPLTQERYYHSFFKEQPDLNWRNAEVKEKMFEMIRFWLEMGIDGFRLDVINLLFKHKKLKNNPVNYIFSNRKVYNRNRPAVYAFLKEFRLLMNRYPGKVSIGEIYAPPPGDTRLVAGFLGDGKDMLHLAFDFSLIFSRWSASSYYKIIRRYYKSLPPDGWPCFVISNHDLGRCVRRLMFSFHKYEKAKIIAVLMLTLKGVPFIYYGDETGMENVHISKEQIQDAYGKMFYPFFKGRDRSRTPMQWDNGPHAGFSNVPPWLPVHPNYKTVNVESELEDAHSILNLYRHLIRLRKAYPALQGGDIHFIDKGKNGILSYIRSDKEINIRVILNFTNRKKSVKNPFLPGEQLLAASPDFIFGKKDGLLVLRPFEWIITIHPPK